MLSHLRPAVVLLLLFTLLTGIAYPLAMTGLAGLLFPHQAGGSLIEKDGKVIGSSLIGQPFTGAGYFHGRPSATSDTDPNDSSKTVSSPYNAQSSTGSNAGPTSKSMLERVQADVDTAKQDRSDMAVPVDLVTASASGLDPDMSPAAAQFQITRVAKARGIGDDALTKLVSEHTEPRWLGLIGEPVVNVLELNLALDAGFPAPASAATPPADAGAAPAAAAPASDQNAAAAPATADVPISDSQSDSSPAAAANQAEEAPPAPAAIRHKRRRSTAPAAAASDQPADPATESAPAAGDDANAP